VSEISAVERFNELLALIEPKDERLRLAAELPAIIRDELTQAPQLRTCEPHTLLVGSYRRHTAVGDIKDVDIAVIVERSYANSTPNVVLDDLAMALDRARHRKRLRRIDRRDQRRSIRCELPDNNFNIDLVPVVAVTGETRGDLWIPDRDQRRWRLTRSVGYLDTFSKLNAKSGQKLVPLVKRLKWWRHQHGIDRHQAKSFWIEALVVELSRTNEITFEGSWPEIAERALRAMYRCCLPVYSHGKGTPVVPDPMIPNANVAHNWQRDSFEEFFGKLNRSRKAAATAVSSMDGAANRAWRQAFGNEFAPSWTDELPAIATVAAVVWGGVYAAARLLTKRG
jgi:hypothetical protein